MTARRGLLLAAAAVALLAVVWAVAVGTAAWSARDRLQAAETELEAARDAVGDLELEEADAAFARADAELATARRRLGRTDVRLASRLPVIGDDLRTARAITLGASGVVDAGGSVTAAILDLPDGVGSLAPRQGSFPTTALAELAPHARASADAVAEARDRVSASPATGLTRQVADARARFLDMVEPVTGQLDSLAALAEALPPLLGHDRPRRYFLAAANPAELRGSGGYLGSYAIATLDGGRLEIGPFSSLLDLPDVPAEEFEPPAPAFADLYAPFGGGGVWKNLNMTPDFPTAATAIEALWEEVHGEPLDGTIVVDPYAFEALLTISGPVRVPGGGTVGADEVVAYVTNEAYTELGAGEERKEILGEVAAAALQGFLEGASEDDLRASTDVLAEVVSGRHLLLHAADPHIQRGLEAVEAAGAFPDPPGDFLAVVANSASNAKVDYYTHRRLDYRVELRADGEARGELDVHFDNRAPAEGPSHVVGPNLPGLDVGDNRFWLSTYCATSCEQLAAEGGLTGRSLSEQELGHPVANTWVEVPRGETATVRYDWRVEDAWEDAGGELIYRLTIRHQVTIPPTSVRIEITVPEGFEVVELPVGAAPEGGAVVYSDEDARGATELELRLRPDEGRS